MKTSSEELKDAQDRAVIRKKRLESGQIPISKEEEEEKIPADQDPGTKAPKKEPDS